jgi:hypothetical protein
VVKQEDQIISIYDAKYKRLEGAPSRGDVYQMVTYCERLGLAEATLVLPGAAGRRSVRVGNRSIHVRGLPGPTSQAFSHSQAAS